MSASGADWVVQALLALGVDIVFGLPGVHNLAIWRALRDSEVRLIGVRHEQAAVYAADGYARTSGRLGVALVTTGPGAANTLGATGEAFASGSPVLVIATDIPTTLRQPGVYRGVLHETRDQPAMFAPVCREVRTVGSADEIADAVMVAGERALRAPSGPVYLGIPTDLLTAAAAGLEPGVPDAGPVAGVAVDAREVAAAARLLGSAQTPLIWAGGGTIRAAAGPAVTALAERLGAPVITTYAGRGLLAPEHPCAVPGPVHHPAVGALWDRADVVVAIGSDLDGMMTQNWAMPAPPDLVAINVDAVDASKNYPPTVMIEADARRGAEALCGTLPEPADRHGRSERLRVDLAQVGEAVTATVAEDDPQAAALLSGLDRILDPATTVVCDMCIPGYWIAGFRRVPAPRRLAYPMGWGTLGFAFPASLGAALAGTGPVVCVTGDGGFLFACGELATLREAAIPVTVVLVDDGGYGMLRYDQTAAGEEPFGVDLVGPDFVALARSFGVAAERVDGFGADFERALESALGSGQPRMLAVSARMSPPVTTSPRWYRRR